MYRSLDPEKIVDTIGTLCRRIDERFPDSGLRNVCGELLTIARALRVDRQASAVAPNYDLDPAYHYG
jgi:hypothetical protein